MLYTVNIRPAPNLYAHAHQTYTSLFTYTIPTYKYTRMHITITLSLSLQFMCTVSILPTLPPQLYAHAYNHRSERIRTCLLSYNYTLLPSKSITSFLSTYITPERDNNPYETLTSQRILSLLTLNIYAALIYKSELCQSLLITYYVFFFVERDCVRVCSFGLCFLIYKKGLCQSQLITYYVFFFVERDCVRVCSFGLCFLIY